MVEDEGMQEEEISSTRGGSALGNFSITQARVMAVRTAQATPTRGSWMILRRKMLFDVLSDHEDESSYTVVVSFRPEGDFDGTPGQERFRFSKTGRFEDREVLSHPKHSRRFRVKSKTVVLGVIVVGGLIGLALLLTALFQTQGCTTRPFCDDDYPSGTTTSP